MIFLPKFRDLNFPQRLYFFSRLSIRCLCTERLSATAPLTTRKEALAISTEEDTMDIMEPQWEENAESPEEPRSPRSPRNLARESPASPAALAANIKKPF